MKVTIIGSAAGGSYQGRAFSAQYLEMGSSSFLIDCGEGTQMRMFDFDINHFTTEAVFISHLHGDHVFGLIGLLNSWSMMGRRNPLHIFAPAGLEELIEVHLRVCNSYISYPLTVHVVDTEVNTKIFENRNIDVWSIPLVHRVPASGYLFREKPKQRTILKDKIAEYNLDYAQIRAAKSGENIELSSGRIVENTELTLPPQPSVSYAYCSDTVPLDSVAEQVSGVSCLYHEATLANEHTEAALAGMHSTAEQAAIIAQKAQVGRLFLGHFSVRYKTLDVLLEEAQAVFPNTALIEEGMVIEIEATNQTKS